MLDSIIAAYGFVKKSVQVRSFGSGLINSTWHITAPDGNYILQRINHQIFKKPFDIADNINGIKKYLEVKFPGYLFVAPVSTIRNKEIFYAQDEGYYRLFPFIKGSHTIDVAESSEQAFEAAKQFGKFTRVLSGFDTSTLKITLPDFHNLSLRYQQFLHSLHSGNKKRINESAEIILFLKEHAGIVAEYERIKTDKNFKLRVTHHDTKISNVLFDDKDKGLCVIDLDTVMPGYFISDAGDMLRTYLSPVSEEEKDFELIKIRTDFFKAIAEGYINEMKEELSPVEKEHFVYAGKFMIYMQAIRFITDYINDDIYYGSKYSGHNFIRANNQVTLLQKLLEKENILKEITRKL